MSLLLSLIMLLSFCSQIVFAADSAADTSDAAAVIADSAADIGGEGGSVLNDSVTDDGESENSASDDAAQSAGQPVNPSDNAAPAADSTMVAEDEVISVDGIEYTLDFYSDSTAKLTDIVASADPAEVTIPSTVTYEGREYSVTSMKFGLFSDKRKNITKLTLPDSLTTVNSSFGKFPNLTEMTILGSIKNFGGNFQNMSKLETLTFKEGVEEISANYMLNGCKSLTAINLPSSLKRITQPAAFSGATALESIALPEGLVVTESSLFDGCTSLISVELPDSMTKIPSNTFSGCTSLQSVTAKQTITSIGNSAFSKCSALTNIPDLGQVTTIGYNAFEECGALTGPLDLSNVTEMGSNAFYYCTGLTGSLDFSKLNKIPSKAFSYTSVDSVTLSDELTAIEKWAFLCTDISTIQFPNTLTSIGTYAFWNAQKLRGTVTIPDSVTTIGEFAFSGTAVEKFEIGSGVESIDASVFTDNAEIIFDNSQDNVTITGTLPANVTVTYTQQSIPDNVGDKISNAADAPTLQEAVNNAAATENGGTVILKKNIKLDKSVTVPAGQTVTITAEQAYQIAGGGQNSQRFKKPFCCGKGRLFGH